MAKAKDAFRTISEVAEWMDTPTHVLRFWESKFSQIKPVKGAGGRRYYRPADMELLGGIKHLLHEEGMTIKGTQKLLREKGLKHVAALGISLSADPVDPPAKPDERPAPVTPKAPAEAAPAPQPKAQEYDADHPQAALPFDEPSALEIADSAQPDTSTKESPPADDANQGAAAFLASFPAPSIDVPAMPARSFGLIFANADTVQQNAAAIRPLVTRLESLRDRLRAQ